MKTLPAVFLLALCAGGGAFVHHLTSDGGPVSPVHNIGSGPMEGPARTPQEEQTLMDSLTSYSGDAESRMKREETVSKPGASDFPALALALKKRRALEKDGGGGGFGPEFTEYWAAADAAGLLAFYEKEYGGASPGTLAACALYDPAAVIGSLRRTAASGKKDSKQRDEAWRGALIQAGELDPAAVMTAAEQSGLLDSPEVTHLGKTALHWAKQDPAAALAFAKKRPSFLGQVLYGWMQKDPEAVFTWMQENQTATRNPDTYAALAEACVEDHPEAAERFRKGVEDANYSLDVSIAAGMAVQDPREAVSLIAKAGNNDRSKLYERLADALARRPAEEAAEIVRMVAEGDREWLYRDLCDRLAYRDPAAAVRFCTGVPELLANEGTDTVFRRYAHQDPKAAAQWMMSGKLPDTLRNRVMPEVVDAWMVTDREAALRFVNSQPPSEVTGRILLESSRIMDDGNIETASAAALTLTDPALRLGAFRWIMERGFSGYSEPEALRTRWIASIPDAAVRKGLLPPPPPPEVHSDGWDPFATPDKPVPDETVPVPGQ